MIQKIVVTALAATLSWTISVARAAEPQIISPNAHKVSYLGVDGAFILGGEESSVNDPRNPGRVVFEQMEFFSFYADVEGTQPIAEGCRYVYRGAAGDPFFYPERSLGSIWDLFELRTADQEECQAFKYVALRSPHGEPVHMHMRYGDAASSFEALLASSTLEEDPETFNPWWSLYCDASTRPEDCNE